MDNGVSPIAPPVPGGQAELEIQAFFASLGAALGAIGETVDAVEERLAVIAAAYGLPDARFTVFPTSLLLTVGQGRAATIEPTTRLGATPRLDQIAAVHLLAEQAERGLIAPGDGIARLEEIRRMRGRYGTVPRILGYATLTVGISLILHPAARDVVGAAVLGALVGVMRWAAHGRRTLEVLMPFLAAFAVALLAALMAKHDVTDLGLRVMISALVVFIPGVALTTAFLELTEGQMIAGASRLVWAGPSSDCSRSASSPASGQSACRRNRHSRAPLRCSETGHPGSGSSCSPSASRSPIRRRPGRSHRSLPCSTPRGSGRSSATSCSAGT